MSPVTLQNILVIVEHSEGNWPTPATLRAVSFAQYLAQLSGGDWSICVFQAEAAITAGLRNLGARRLFACPVDEQRKLLPEFLAPSVCSLIREREFDCIIGAETSLGKDLLPRIAGALHAPYVGGCTGVHLDEYGTRFLKPVYAGNAVLECQAQEGPVVVALGSAAFGPAAPTHAECPVVPVAVVDTGATAQGVELLGVDVSSSERPDLAEARTIVSGGRMLGKGFFELLGPLADLYGAALGATRALCDLGHVPSNLQVGQTGRIVSPDLYFAIGISGSVQHLAGMRGSRVIVAINNDPDAPIFAHADLGLVADMWHAVPCLVGELAAAHRTR
ncbi:MAG TPA: electron transfer flavoprotein subunit alpha/FixB family protein [Polyangiaceae bacterium]|nr:electron transfer flavoprotein subunit alpha/FixB family protein [Polyangiaceae bacterium]